MLERWTRVYLLRHGEVDAAWHGRIYGALNVPLSQGGHAEAEASARKLEHVELRAVVSSGLARTEHGAACLRRGRPLPRIDDPELRELERGEWAGLTLLELERRDPGAWDAWSRRPASVRAPGGESLLDLQHRVRPRVQHWASEHAGGSIALVTHGWVVRVLVCEALGLGLDLAPRIDIRTGDVAALHWPLASQREPPLLAAFALDRTPD
jgi:broad specificity phosphatase PhoE